VADTGPAVDPSREPDGTAMTVRRLVDALDVPTAVLRLDGRIVHANGAASTYLGLTPAELTARRLPELTAEPDATERLLREWAGSAHRRAGAVVLTVGPRPDQRVRVDGSRLDATSLLVRFRDGETQDPLAALTRELETASLRELQGRLRRTLGALEESNRTLATRNAELDRYAAAVAHDLRSPLYAVRGFAELLTTHLAGADADARTLVAEILRGADRMVAVIDGLLAVARLQVRAPDEPADTAAALAVALDEHRAQIDEFGAQVEVGPLEPAWAETTHLAQVFSNLVGNSLKFRDPDRRPTIRVGARRTAGAVTLTVDDAGIGVAADDRERIFELFDRGSRPADRPGTGVGLATTRKIVESYSGTIRCEDSDLGGARFVVTIPDPSFSPDHADAYPRETTHHLADGR
jgi:signal transduction histidine kinase